MPKMEAIISVRYRVPLDTKVPDAEFENVRNSRAEVMKNDKAVDRARKQAAKDAEDVAKGMKKGNVIDVLVEEVRDA